MSTDADDPSLRKLIEELQAYTELSESDPVVVALVRELDQQVTARRGGVDASLLAGTLPLLHRIGPKSLDDFLKGVAATHAEADAALRPGEGSATRQALLAELGEDRCVYFWLGHCAYTHPDPEFLWIWAAEAERSGPPGMAAPWDTAGLCTQSSLGRNLTVAEAVRCVRKHSLPIQGRDAPLHRQYLASVLERSFAHPDDYWHGVTPVAWYPGWLMPPPRTAQSGSKEEAPHHTFEVRRQGPVPLVDGLLGVVAMDAVLARNSKATRNLERWVRRHAVWEEGKRLHKVDTRRGRTVIRTASDLVERYLNEQGAS